MDTQDIDFNLVGEVKQILENAAEGKLQQFATDIVSKRLIQFGTKAGSFQLFENACKMFGRFDSNSLQAAYNTIQAYQKGKAKTELASKLFAGVDAGNKEHQQRQSTSTSSDRLGGGDSSGGLVYVPKSRRRFENTEAEDSNSLTSKKYSSSTAEHRPTTSDRGKSALGLDKLAAKLRADAVKSMRERQDTKGEETRKEEIHKQDAVKGPQFRVQHVPSSLRKRRADTPSDPGGVSASAQQRLEEHRRRLTQRHRQADPHTGGRSRIGDSERDTRRDHRPRSRSPDRRDGGSERGTSRSSGKRDESRSSSRIGTPGRPSTSSGKGSRWDMPTPQHRQQLSDTGRREETRDLSRSFGTPGRPSTGGNSRGSRWDAPTPQHRQAPTTPRWRQWTDIGGREDDNTDTTDRREWEAAQRQLDRDWYGGDETGGAVDDAHNPFADYVDHDDRLEAKLLGQQAKRMTARQMQYSRDNDRWETNRLTQSGVMQTAGADDVDDDADGARVHLLVHDLKPPFLEGTVLTRLADPVQTVVDPTSDLAVFSRKGSALVRDIREKRERMKATRDAVDAAGTTLGNVMGVVAEETQDMQKDEASAQPPKPTPAEKPAAEAQQTAFGGSEFSRSRSLREQREFLPAFACRDALMQTIGENQVTVVVGETGSGKTTQLAQYLHEAGYTRRGMIACTQPRRVAAMSVAKRVAEEMDVTVGGTVGYAIRFEDCTSPQTLLKYMTDGVLLREALARRDLAQYSAVIIDEAHERTLNTDVLLGLLRQIASSRRDIKIIVTSATMDAQRFADFFGSAPVFTIPGRTFPVDAMFSKTPCEDYVDSAVRQTLTIHLSQPPGDILVFMTGQEDIEACCDALRDRLAAVTGAAPLTVLPIYSQLPADLQAKIFEPAPARKAVVATNIAETSLTVDGVRYVVDCGFYKLKVYNPRIGMDSLQVTPIAQANARQRAGRAGRTAPGVAYRLYTERAFRDEMFAAPIPEIQRTNLAYVVMLLKSIGVGSLEDFDFLDPPPRDTIRTSMYQLWTLGALDNIGGITDLGRRMVHLPLDPAPAKMLATAQELGCAAEIVTIVSMLAVPSVFYRPKERLDESDAAREKFFVPESDHLTLLNVYNQWRANGYRDSWCVRHFVLPKSMRKAREVRDQLVDIMQQASPTRQLASAGANWDIIRQCICSAYFHHAARTKSLGEYSNLRTGMPCHVHPTSALYGMGYTPDYIVYHELVYTSKEYMQCVTAVDPRWLAEMGPMFFSLREPGETRTHHAQLHLAKFEAELLEQKKQKKEEEEEETAQSEKNGHISLSAIRGGSKTGSARASRSSIVTPGSTPRFKTPRRRTHL
ncbi:hypothetical protein GGI11_000340 [Coemansia sp. RSA 2049]|nr:hypothetical protein GGI11_000340 [Coemansia sp. RSA 2049]